MSLKSPADDNVDDTIESRHRHFRPWLVVAWSNAGLSISERVRHFNSGFCGQSHPIVTTEQDRNSLSAVLRKCASHWNLTHQFPCGIHSLSLRTATKRWVPSSRTSHISAPSRIVMFFAMYSGMTSSADFVNALPVNGSSHVS